jgi:hypothetical protein
MRRRLFNAAEFAAQQTGFHFAGGHGDVFARKHQRRENHLAVYTAEAVAAVHQLLNFDCWHPLR